MKNKLDKEYLLKIYKTYEKDNMFYGLIMLKSLGFKDWFKSISLKNFYSSRKEIFFIIKNIKFIDMFDLNEFSSYYIYNFILYVDNEISYFNQEQLNKLARWQIKDIIEQKPELEKYLINCENYEKQIR